MYAAMEKPKRSVTIVCAVLLQLWSVSYAFNLDTKFPVIYHSSLGNYFGYTVALHKNKDGPMVLVGAPRANSSRFIDQIHQPGVLFKCNIPSSSSVKAECEEVTLYTEGNTERADEVLDKKDNMWLGVSLDIQQDQTQNEIVTCGHLWKNQYYRHHYLVNGVCYVINSDLDPNSVRKLMPLIKKEKQAIIPPGIYYYAMGQSGTSAAYSEDGKSLILGAPGLYDWIGSIVSYPTDPSNASAIYKKPAVPNPPGGPSPESYLGYSVTSGKFFDNNKILYAAGAPRDSLTRGGVYIFRSLEQKKDKLLVHQKKEGTQMGEYFGAAVLGINVNADAYTDLLVGAPFHSLEYGGDEGKVVVYLSNGVNLQSSAELLGESKPNARFGSAIANIGDLNQDGFIDVAIGAPYEDGKGAVYIYHGSGRGMNVQYAQKIEATSIDSSLSGFGIHISRGVDIDNNQYPDILVGSYASSNAVLFRTSPVVQLSSKIIFSPDFTDCEYNHEKLNCVNVSACLLYAGKTVPLSLDFENDIFVEHPGQTTSTLPRGFFVNDGKAGYRISGKTNLKIRVNKCIKHLLYFNIKTVITPIQILFKYRLAVPPQPDDVFDKSFPVIDPSTPTSIRSGKIEATSINSSSSGLGINISRGVDIDNNQYPDILNGSYASSNAELFRTRPVLNVSSKIIFSPNFADCQFNNEKLGCVNISACLWYAGENVPPSLDFENDIFVEQPGQTDSTLPGGFFVDDGKPVYQIPGKTNLKTRINKCITRLLYFDIKTVITPIQILFKYRLSVPPEADDEFNKSFPVIDPSTPTSVRSGITFQTGYFQGNKCVTNQVVPSTLLGGEK